METDSVYRDSVRTVIRDSLMIHSPEYRKRMEDREKEKRKQQLDSTKRTPKSDSPKSNVDTIRTTAIKNEDEERSYHAS